MKDFHTIKLKDGRDLSYAEYGDKDGFPVIYCHGWPSGKYEALYFDSEAQTYGIRLIAIDRPGMGDSTFLPGAGYYDWPNDVIQLIDTMGYEKFGVFGVSGGTPFALACAHKFPNRIKKTYIYGGFAPINARDFGTKFAILKALVVTSTKLPRLAKWSISFFRKILKKWPAAYLWMLKMRIPREDKKRASQKGIDIFLKNKIDSTKNGATGAFHETKLLLHDWDFDFKEINNYVKFWIGTKDDLTPIEMTEYFNEVLPNSDVTVIESGSHFAITEIVDEIFDTMKKGYENS